MIGFSLMLSAIGTVACEALQLSLTTLNQNGQPGEPVTLVISGLSGSGVNQGQVVVQRREGNSQWNTVSTAQPFSFSTQDRDTMTVRASGSMMAQDGNYRVQIQPTDAPGKPAIYTNPVQRSGDTLSPVQTVPSVTANPNVQKNNSNNKKEGDKDKDKKDDKGKKGKDKNGAAGVFASFAAIATTIAFACSL